MNQGIIFAVITASALGLWTVFHNQASKLINPLLGAILVSGIGALLGIILILPKLKTFDFSVSTKGMVYIFLLSVAVLAIDFFALKTYGSGLPVSVGGPIIIAGSIAVATIIGFSLGESITLLKVIAIMLIILGSVILSRL